MALDTFNPYLFVSAGEQSNKFLTPAYAGGIAQFQAQRAQELTGLTVRIDPIQEGTGDPSPTNIRPISGRTGLTVTRAGKNLLDAQSVWGEYYQDGVYVNPHGTQKFYIPQAYVGKEITISAKVKANETNSNCRIRANTNGTTNDSKPKVNTTGEFTQTTLTFTPQSSNDYIILISSGANGSYKDIMLNLGSTATDYEPYTAQEYPISWQTEAGTVYGGTLDVVSGVLTAEYGIITFNGTETWNDYSGFEGYFIKIAEAKVSVRATAWCNMLSYSNSTAYGQKNKFWMGANSKYYFAIGVYESMGATMADFKAYLAEHNMQVVYPLATPQTYQLTPTEIKTLAGFNQIYSDAGPVIGIKF